MEELIHQNPGLISSVDDRERRDGPFIRKGATALIYVTGCIRIVLFGCFFFNCMHEIVYFVSFMNLASINF